VTDVGLAIQWAFNRLTADSQMQALVGNRIYRSAAPEGAGYPLVVLSAVAYGQENAAGNRARPIRSVDLLVRAWNTGADYAGVHNIASRVDALLHVQDSWSSSGFVVEGGKRIGGALTLDEIIDGERYVSAGGLYRIFVAEEV